MENAVMLPTPSELALNIMSDIIRRRTREGVAREAVKGSDSVEEPTLNQMTDLYLGVRRDKSVAAPISSRDLEDLADNYLRTDLGGLVEVMTAELIFRFEGYHKYPALAEALANAIVLSKCRSAGLGDGRSPHLDKVEITRALVANPWIATLILVSWAYPFDLSGVGDAEDTQ